MSKQQSKLSKLLKGIVLYATFNIVFDKIDGADGLHKLQKNVALFLDFLPTDLASIIATLIELAFDIGLLYCFISGMYRICTFNKIILEYEGHK
jgi:hypothetical protein